MKPWIGVVGVLVFAALTWIAGKYDRWMDNDVDQLIREKRKGSHPLLNRLLAVRARGERERNERMTRRM